MLEVHAVMAAKNNTNEAPMLCSQHSVVEAGAAGKHLEVRDEDTPTAGAKDRYHAPTAGDMGYIGHKHSTRQCAAQCCTSGNGIRCH
jgi:hypothetical protein